VASQNDTLDVEVHVAGSNTPVRYAMPVPITRPPVVIRTSPPHQKRDVPLNMNIIVVFSEPIALASLTATSVQLTSASGRVQGQVGSGDPEHLTATFIPNTALAPSTDYTLTITQGILDLDGQALESAVTVQFTTGAAPPPPPGNFDGNWTGSTSQGRTISFTVRGDTIRNISVGFALTGDCGIAGVTDQVTGIATPILGAQLNLGSPTGPFVVTGSFASPTTAAGSASANYTATLLNGTNCRSTAVSTWTATRP
jgi:hypothetical protein